MILPKNIGPEINKLKLDFAVEYDFDGVAKSLNKSLELRIKQGFNNATANATTAAKENIQISRPNSNETAAAQSQANTPVEKALPIKENLKSGFINKDNLIIGAVVLVVIAVISLIIHLKNKKKNGINKPKEEKALKEIQEKFLKK